MPTTPRGYITYPAEGDTSWYTTAENGLEAWLLRAELLGIPTYDTFSDLPTAGSTETVNPGTGQTQRQFAAVVADATIYRDDGSAWQAWANYYTDSDAVSALESASSVVPTGEWRFEDELSLRGTANSEDGGDAVINLRPNPNDATLDALVKFLSSDGGQRAAWMYDQDAEEVRLWNYFNGGNKIRIPLSDQTPVNFPPGAESGGNPVPYSSSGTEYDIQKNGTDGAGNINLDATNGRLTADGDVIAQDDPENRELMGQASDTDGTTNLDMTVSHATGYDEVQFSAEVNGNDSSTSFGLFIQLNGDTGASYDYNRMRNGSLLQTTGDARFTSQVWGSNTEKNRFAVDGGSSQNFISQMTGSADNRYQILSGDQTSAAADGPITDIRVFGNFNASGSLYAIGIPGP